MVGNILNKNGLDNPIVDIKWKMQQPDDYNKIQITTDKPLNEPQMLCAEQCFNYLMKESAYESNKNNHMFWPWMHTDDAFIKTIQNTYHTGLAPFMDNFLL